MYPPKIHFLETRLPVSQRQADEHQPVYKTASVTTHGPSSRFSLLPHLSAQLKRWDPTVRINGRISTTENCQYLPRPPQNWTHKWKNSSSQHIPLSHRNRYVPLFLILCPHTVPVIPCLLFLMLSTIVSPSLLQIITPLRLVILHTHTPKKEQKKSIMKKTKANRERQLFCLMNTSAEPSAAERLWPLCCFFSFPSFPGTLENYALSLWTDYRQLKVWQHLKLSPRVANDFPATDITFNASAAVISIRRAG